MSSGTVLSLLTQALLGLSWLALPKNVSRELSEAVEIAIRSYNNLRRLMYMPFVPDAILATAIIGMAVNSPALSVISLKCNMLTESLIVLMCQLRTVKAVHLISPNEPVLFALPSWIDALVNPLEELHLEVRFWICSVSP